MGLSVSQDAFANASAALRLQRKIRSASLRRLAGELSSRHREAAERALRDYVAGHPRDPDGLQMLAQHVFRLGQKREAATIYEKCLELAPDADAARYQYADLLAQLNRFADALTELDILLARDSRNPLFRNLKASILETIGETRQSAEIFADLVAENPGRAETWVSYGHSLRAIGRQDESIAAYRRAIECRPFFGHAHWGLANMKTVRLGDGDIDAIKLQLSRTDIPSEDRVMLQFTLAKAYEDRREYERSFEYYAKANAVLRLAMNYDPATLTAGVAANKALFTPEFFRSRQGAGCQTKGAIFIVGRPRSGSTLIEQILASHSAIEGTAELPYIGALSSRLANRDSNSTLGAKYLPALATVTSDDLTQLGEEYLRSASIHRKLDRPFFIDKKPGNFFHIGLIHLILPNVKIIDARRHPAANGLSMFKSYSSKGRLRLSELGHFYRDYVELMAHFDTVLPGKVHRVIYEQLVADPEAEVRRLLEYLGLPFEENCLRFHETQRTVLTPSSEQVRRPISGDAVDYWRAFEPYLGPLLSSLGSALACYPEVPEELR
ncbi:MAG: repeat domain protein [Spartobacteria bacterium]|nr:repeat domain protein [Spartobacteria bacterium]